MYNWHLLKINVCTIFTDSLYMKVIQHTQHTFCRAVCLCLCAMSRYKFKSYYLHVYDIMLCKMSILQKMSKNNYGRSEI